MSFQVSVCSLFKRFPRQLNHKRNTYSPLRNLSSSSALSYTVLDANHIIKSQASDNDREYNILQFDNGFECIIVSDENTEKSSCAMSINVGHFSDPSEYPGIAHLLEHMLFLGSKKYPTEGEYKKYIKSHGGQSNASTGMKQSTYHFDVDHQYLQSSFDHFIQFFIPHQPLLTRSSIAREVKAVDSENSNNLQSDGHRMYQLDKYILAPHTHPFSKFGTGNIQTLMHLPANDISSNSEEAAVYHLRQNLCNFYEQYYTQPSMMKLAVVGKESVTELSEMVCEQFISHLDSNLQQENRPLFESLNSATNRMHFETNVNNFVFRVIPISEKRELRINWMLTQSSYDFDAISKPLSLISYCLGDEKPGSILSYLKKNGWATNLSAGLSYSMKEFSMYAITIELTPNGLQNWMEIINVVKQYIHYNLSELNENEWQLYFNERSKLSSLNFNLMKSKESPYNYARQLCSILQIEHIPRENLLQCMAGVYLEFNYSLIKQFIQDLNEKNSFYQIIAKEFENNAEMEKEYWYGTKFSREKISDKIIDEWNDCSFNTHLECPLPNKFIADDFTLYCESSDMELEMKSELFLKKCPTVICENERLKVWFLMDSYFKQPKMEIQMLLKFPSVSDLNEDIPLELKSQLMMQLLTLILDDELCEDTYAFEEAGLHYSLNFSSETKNTAFAQFSFSGFNQKLHLLTNTVLEKFCNILKNSSNISESTFDRNYEQLKRSIFSLKKMKPYQHLSIINSYLMFDSTFTIQQMEECISKYVDYQSCLEYYQQILCPNIFSNSSTLECLIFGNCSTESIQPFMNLMNDHLLYNNRESNLCFNDSSEKLLSCLQLPQNGNEIILCFQCPNEDEINNHAISNQYIFTLDSDYKKIKHLTVLMLFSQLINAPLFDELRTKQQLGYVVWSLHDINRGLMSFQIIIQSQIKVCATPLELDEKIELFLEAFYEKLLVMDEENVSLNRKSVINDLLIKPKSISEQMNRFWSEIVRYRYQFQRRESLVNEMKSVTKLDLIQFMDEYLLRNCKSGKSKRCKVSVQCFPSTSVIPVVKGKQPNSQNIQVKDIPSLREMYGYYLYPYPYNHSCKL